MREDLPVETANLGLWTDLYELTMLRGYLELGITPRVTFDLFVRKLPENRSFLIAAGLETALKFLERVAFCEEAIRYLREVGPLADASERFWDRLREFRFRGDVRAAPEGTVFFADEPILSVTASLPEAQLVETSLISILTFQSMVATKANRVVRAAEGRGVVDFGARRAHGLEAALHAARSSYIGGCMGTSHVEAGRRFGIPIFGTMAHSWVMAFESEKEAFEAYLQIYGENSVLLIDTYNTLEGARRAVESGPKFRAVRIDSGDLGEEAKRVRRILDEAGRRETNIVLSSDLNEYKISELIRNGAPVNAFGVGTEMVVSADAPSLSGVYKLVDVETGRGPTGRLKESSGKATWPGKKQVYRTIRDGRFVGDRIALMNEPAQEGEIPLLETVMRNGERVKPSESLEEIRDRVGKQTGMLGDEFLAISRTAEYPVRISKALESLREEITSRR